MQKQLFRAGPALALAAGLGLGAAQAGAPEGHPESIERELRGWLEYELSRNGLLNDTSFGFALKAFVWDHRRDIDPSMVGDGRLVDAAACLLQAIYGAEPLIGYLDNLRYQSWCEELTRDSDRRY